MRIEIVRERCIGAGRCVWAAPDVFTQDDDAIGEVLPGHEETPEDPRIRDAVETCPVQAVRIS